MTHSPFSTSPGILIPLIFFETCWWCQAVRHDYFSYFPERYLLSITMVGGATVAGMTSEGGGAVAFPVMTLALGIKVRRMGVAMLMLLLQPAVARDFSLMIQSCGQANLPSQHHRLLSQACRRPPSPSSG